MAFMYVTDSTSPEITLSTSSPRLTTQSTIYVIAEFKKPVFGFDAPMVIVQGGRITRQVHINALERTKKFSKMLIKKNIFSNL